MHKSTKTSSEPDIRANKIDLLQPSARLQFERGIRNRLIAMFQPADRHNFTRENVLTHFRRQLKATRRDLGYKQRDMAIILGVSVSRYAAIENGSGGDISITMAARLAQAINCSVELCLVPFTEAIEHVDQPVTPPVRYYADELAQAEIETMWINTELDRRKQQAIESGAVSHPVGDSTTLNKRELSRFRIPSRDEVIKELEDEEYRRRQTQNAQIEHYKKLVGIPGKSET